MPSLINPFIFYARNAHEIPKVAFKNLAPKAAFGISFLSKDQKVG
jgi:hypothetical protein